MMRGKRHIFGFLLGLLCVALCTAVRVGNGPLVSTFRGAGFDTLQNMWPRSKEPPQPVRIVDIDEASLKSIGQWPWPRDQLAKIVRNLTRLGASAIVFDILFAEPDRLSPSAIASTLKNIPPQNLPDNDKILSDAITQGPVVLAFASTHGKQESLPLQKAGFAQTGLDAKDAPPRLAKIISNLPMLDQSAAGLGNMNIDLANDQGVARQIPLLRSDGKNFYPSLVLEALRVAQRADTFVINASSTSTNAIETVRVGSIEIPTSETGMLQVNYRPYDPELYVSAEKLLSNDIDALRPLVEGNIVLIGTSAVGLLDTRTSSLGEAIPGVSVHAQAIEQILAEAYLTRPSWIAGGEFLLTGLLGVLLSWLAILWRPALTLGAMASILAGLAAVTAVSYRHYGLLFDFTFPAVTLLLTFISTIAYKLLVTDREGRQLRRVFGHYVAPSILAEIERNPENLKLGGEVRDLTVMFVDIENFTPLAEKLAPQHLVKIINGVMQACSAAILEEDGTIDKYIGDAVMAFWNAPVAIADHQYHACSAALKIDRNLIAFNNQTDIKAQLLAVASWPISVRMGLASGPAVVGNMGSLDRFDYSALGDAVNTAARTENSCKLIGHNILLAGEVHQKTARLALLAAGAITLRGKTSITTVHAILGNEDFAADQQFKNFKLKFENEMAVPKQSAFKKLETAFPQFQKIIAARYSRI